MTSIQIRRHELRFLPDCSRVLIRPFIPADRSRLTQMIGRALALSEEETGRELEKVRREFHYHPTGRQNGFRDAELKQVCG
jgi:hypothetical protein